MKLIFSILFLSVNLQAVDLTFNIVTPRSALEIKRYALHVAAGTNRFHRVLMVQSNCVLTAYNVMDTQFRFFLAGETEDGYPTTPTPITVVMPVPATGNFTNSFLTISPGQIGKEMKTEVFFPAPPKSRTFRMIEIPPVPGGPIGIVIPPPIVFATLTNQTTLNRYR